MRQFMSFINSAFKPSTASKKMESLKKRSLKMEPLEERQLLSVNIGTADDLDDLTAAPLVATTTSNTDLVADLGESPQNTENTPQALNANDNTQTETPIALNAQTVTVTSESELDTALDNVQAGDIIQLGANISLTEDGMEYMVVAQEQNFTLDLNGCTLKQTDGTCPVIANYGTLTIIDSSTTQSGTITGGSDGIFNKGVLTLNGGKITGNGHGIDNSDKSGKLTVGGNTQITDNGNKSNVILLSGKKIDISTTNPLTTGATIGVTMWNNDEESITGTFAENVTASDAQYFFADADDKGVTYDNGSLKVVNKFVVTSEGDLTTALANVQAGDTIQLGANIELTATVNVTADMDFTLDLNGKTLKANATDDNKYSVITNAGTLVITDSSSTDPEQQGTITGGKCIDSTGFGGNGGGINNTGGTLTLAGAILRVIPRLKAVVFTTAMPVLLI